MRLICFLACLGFLMGCSNATHTPLTSDEPGDLPANVFDPPRDAQGLLGGLVTLNGSGATVPEGLTAPYRKGIPSEAGDIALVKLRVTSTPASTKSLRARFLHGSTQLAQSQVSATGAYQYRPFYVETPGQFDLELYNSLTSSSPLYPGLAHWQYHTVVRAAEDPREPNDDDSAASVTDRLMGPTNLREGAPLFGSFYRKDAGVTEDLEDWYRIDLTDGIAYRFPFANSNGQWGTWRYTLNLVSDRGVSLASFTTSGTGGALNYTPDFGGTRPYFLQVTATPESRQGTSVYFGEYSLGMAQGPRLSDVVLSDTESLTEIQFGVTSYGGAVDTWEWSFGSGASPSTSVEFSPLVTLGDPGEYAGSVIARGPGGVFTLPFTYTVTPVRKAVGLHVKIVKFDDTTWPVLWGNLAGWNEEAMKDWAVEHLNPAFRTAGFKFTRELVTMEAIVDGRLFNIDSSSESGDLQDLCVQGDPTKLNITMVNGNNYSGTYGQMQDHSEECNFDNALRGCWAISVRNSFEELRSTMAHELGHVVYLPHICTGGCSDPAKYDNLMSYMRDGSIRLWDDITRESGSNCYMSNATQMNQNQVAFDWVDEYLP